MSGLLSHKPVGGAPCQGYFHINLLVVLHVRVTFTLTCWWCSMSGLHSHSFTAPASDISVLKDAPADSIFSGPITNLLLTLKM